VFFKPKIFNAFKAESFQEKVVNNLEFLLHNEIKGEGVNELYLK
jgi:hypothetical protein